MDRGASPPSGTEEIVKWMAAAGIYETRLWNQLLKLAGFRYVIHDLWMDWDSVSWEGLPCGWLVR